MPLADSAAAIESEPTPIAGNGASRRRRSKVTSGRAVFIEGDGNSAWSRRYRDLVAGHVSDLGGSDLLSEAQKSLVRRSSAIECELEQMEGKLSKGEEVDLDAYGRATIMIRIDRGSQGRAHPVGPERAAA